MNNDHAAHRSRTEGFDIAKPHVALTCVPVSHGSYCLKTVLLIERQSGLKVIAVSQGLNVTSRDSLSALEPSDPGPMYIRKFRVLPLLGRFCEEQVQYRRSERRHLDSPSSYWCADNSSCLRRSSSTTCSDDSTEDCGIGGSVDLRPLMFPPAWSWASAASRRSPA